MRREPRDEQHMATALELARKGVGQTSPNPAVGAILVIAGKVVARGYHRRAGASHAEIECIQSFGARIPKGATLYVTLEPCSSAGRTPPCTEAIAGAGIRRLVVGATDPNPRHAGRGIEFLRKTGVTVRAGILAAACSELNEGFNKWIQTGRPFVTAKCGMSLDGRLTKKEGQWITSVAARRHARQLRTQTDAILIGAQTLRADNPRLTVRGLRKVRQPWRVVLTRSERLPRAAHLFNDDFAQRTLVFRDQPLDAVLRELGEKEITSVLIEGGGDVLGQALDGRMIDKMQIYLGPLCTGGPVVALAGRGVGSTAEAARLERVRYERIGSDICIAGYPAYSNANSE